VPPLNPSDNLEPIIDRRFSYAVAWAGDMDANGLEDIVYSRDRWRYLDTNTCATRSTGAAGKALAVGDFDTDGRSGRRSTVT
jgi:hypothetical protein